MQHTVTTPLLTPARPRPRSPPRSSHPRCSLDPEAVTGGDLGARILEVTQHIVLPLAGAGIGLVVAVIAATILRMLVRKSRILTALVKRTSGPGYWMFITWGAYLGQFFAVWGEDLTTYPNGAIIEIALHALLILGILATTWVVRASLWILEDAARIRQEADGGGSRRFETQAQVLRRLGQLIVLILGLCFVAFTFPGARQGMATVLASAGIISVVAGLAAQSTLGNVFAGIQLAFTDAIRVGDVVVAGPKNESGAIEEITLSYVVVRIWDERRLVIPSSFFTTTTFENWTRRAAKQLGTVELRLDWAAPMALIRAKVEEIITATDLWDGRSWAVQMTDSDKDSVVVRVLLSAENSGRLWDLRCHVRESLIQWIVEEEPWVRPTTRYQRYEAVRVEHDPSHEVVARLAAELSGIAADTTAAPASTPRVPQAVQEDADDAVHAARLTAARQKAKKARRRAFAQRQRDLAQGRQEPAAVASSEEKTQILSMSQVGEILAAIRGQKNGATEGATAAAKADTDGRGSRLYSGSPDAEERSQIFAGPGQEAIEEREAAVRARHKREAEEGRKAHSSGASALGSSNRDEHSGEADALT
ncbi:mechanosensitive ion channel family protein [Schaalia sp. Marseille-Q2122]|uniref:mechanosensitive ion channel family protein n=1 Tax=Schaalia sp. Marseille-Q2122 TaxID=2736604 RepID=UPI00158BC38C|nr:mechanosensitive ion channel family protein [Schaalia sp. Marseille-Q2122]